MGTEPSLSRSPFFSLWARSLMIFSQSSKGVRTCARDLRIFLKRDQKIPFFSSRCKFCFNDDTMCGLCHVLSDHFGFICFCLRETVNLIRFGSVILIYFVKLVSFHNIMQETECVWFFFNSELLRC